MKKLKSLFGSLFDRERLQAWRARAQPAWALVRTYGARLYKYGRIGAREAWIVLQRLPIASLSFARALASPDYAEDLRALHADQFSTPGVGSPRKPAVTPPPPAKAAELEKAPPDSALLLLSLLQKEGRFIDFMQEDVASYTDEDIGAAARVVHQGCARVLREHLHIAPVRTESEGAQVTLEPGFNPTEVRPTGQVVGEPPFTGSLVHRGWRATDIQLPKIATSHDLHILAAAEVEL
ncbi:DUF2760 domain-containing protein [Rhabdochromatium marinum]|uniref:DUF2760 domain-containing protein n=1 Tax=Rhabdochromatium marinum TaxID=48729 RepID=UPI0019057470|nr:DUF2760 domain-containing protein [Rhabdochromatium marinum]MBK1650084.1 hypothetical protein [Rhabdochromatium marinum]